MLDIYYPLVTVIIPCFNYGKYLPEAFESIRLQDYPNIEIIVVDDGSTDNTKDITEKNQKARYIYQINQGLSAARNTGIKNSKGELIIFLDADDMLLPDAINTNLYYLKQNEELAFVSGAFEMRFTESGEIVNKIQEVKSDHYSQLLKGNYIGVPAAVLYRRWIFDEMLFDISLKNCQDYDLYLKIAREYPVFHHTKKIATYRIHTSNMSSNIPAMLSEALYILERQKNHLRTISEKKAYKKGKKNWKYHYCQELYQKLRLGKIPVSGGDLMIFIKHKPLFLFRYILTKILLR